MKSLIYNLFKKRISKSILTTFVVLIGTMFIIQGCGETGGVSLNGLSKTAPAATTPATPTFSFSPSHGNVGSIVTVSSIDIDLSATTSITINGVSQIILSKSASQAAFLVMPGTIGGAVNVTVPSTTHTSSATYSMTASSSPANQQGLKLVGSSSDHSLQGSSVSLSADGNTAIVGGDGDNISTGAAWVFVRNSGGGWTQQAKLVGSNSGQSQQGSSVSLSADGNTAIVGGNGDNSFIGAAWVFVRNSGGGWTQQAKLVGSNSGQSQQGSSVSLSADGNTAIVGGYGDNSFIGAAWVFVRNSGGGWTQQAKLVGSNSGQSQQGSSVSLSADGNTAIVGGDGDNISTGAAWVFVRNSGGGWTQQAKLVGSNSGQSQQGSSVSLSADGNTAIVGGNGDNSFIGAAWVFVRNSGGGWTQQAKLVGSNSGQSQQGSSVSLSADGNTAIVGGNGDNSYIGAAWVFVRNSGGGWTQQAKLVGSNSGQSQQGSSVSLSADGNTAIVGGYSDNSYTGAAWVFVP